MIRSNEAMVITGRKRTGKSTLTNEIAEGFAKKNPDKRVLIINVNNSEAYKKHPVITYEGMKRWKKGIYQFYDPDHEKMLDFLMTHFNPQVKKFRGLIVFEDATKYIDANPNKQIKTFLVDHRMWDVDMLFTFHSLSFVPLFFWRMVTRVILLKTNDVDLNQFAKRVPNWKDVSQAYARVMKHPNNFHHEIVSTLI
jgi:hypothetical protein